MREKNEQVLLQRDFRFENLGFQSGSRVADNFVLFSYGITAKTASGRNFWNKE